MLTKKQKYSVSVSARTYDRLRAVVPGCLAWFIDDIMIKALDDPTTRARVLAKSKKIGGLQ